MAAETMNMDRANELVDELQELINEQLPEMVMSYGRIRDRLRNGYGWPEMDALRVEVALCLAFGRHQAAMTMTNHMLESFLKISLGYAESFKHLDEGDHEPTTDGLVKMLRPGFERYNRKNLYDSIEAAFDLGLIDSDQKVQLHIIRQSFRNAYSHADREKIHGESEIPVQGVHFGNKGPIVEPKSARRIVDLPFIQGEALAHHARANATDYFLYLDTLVRKVRFKLFPENDL